MRPATLFLLAAAALWVGGQAGCRPGPSSMPLSDTDPIFVVPAVAELADTTLSSSEAARLVELLDHPDAAIRLAAGETLQIRSGGETFGYRFWADAPDREAAIARWQDWLARRYGSAGR